MICSSHGGELNLADLGKGFPEEPKKPHPEPSKPLRLYIGRLAVTGGSSTFEDLTRADPFKADFNPITFELHDFSTVGERGNAYSLTAASEDGELFNWSGTLRLTPLSSQGQFEVIDLRARTIWDYIRDLVPLELDSGLIGIKGDYDLSTGGGPLAVKALIHNTTVTDLGVKPKGGAQDYVKLAKIEVDDTRVDVSKHTVDIAKVTLSGGNLDVWMDEQGRLNLLDLAPAPTTPVSTPPPTEPPAVHAQSSGGNSAPWVVSAPDIGLEGFKVAAEDRFRHQRHRQARRQGQSDPEERRRERTSRGERTGAAVPAALLVALHVDDAAQRSTRRAPRPAVPRQRWLYGGEGRHADFRPAHYR